EAALAPIRAAGTAVVDSVGPQTPGSIGEITQEPVEPTSFMIETSTFDELTPELIGVLLKHAGQPSLIFQVQLRHLRAGQEVGHSGVAAADPAAKYSFSALSILPVPELEQPAHRALLALKDAVAPWQAGASVPSMLAGDQTLQDVFSEPDLARLREIKQRVDPVGLLVGSFPVVH
ncbi:MAG: hypothetical protein QOH03_2084, partial [Kribbellaceae bacterium]|nr:hypothetical protein [Kribbellaceae bacterium]